MERILIVEDNLALLHMQKDWLENAGYVVCTAIDEPSARKWLRKEAFGLVFSDVRFPEGDGISLLEWIAKEGIDVPFVIMTEYASIADAVRAVKLGAKDYLPKPVYREQLLNLAKEWLRTPVSIRKKETVLFKRISLAAQRTEELAKRVATSDINVLILGANGTGKESVAQTIHRKSSRKDKPFVAVNCGAVPRELASSYFFGHVKGAFTGAVSDKKGYFEIAEGGTLFLDELGTLPYDIQAMLLRVLQESSYMPVGGTREQTADVRIIAATNEDMPKAIAEGRFREDLYHRLNGIEIHQPSLAECPEDIIPLCKFFIERYAKELKRVITGLTEDAEQVLLSYPWPGNIRELQHKVKRAVLLSESDRLSASDFDLPPMPSAKLPFHLDFKVRYGVSGGQDEVEKRRIVETLSETGGNLSETAKRLGISRPTLNRRLGKYGLK